MNKHKQANKPKQKVTPSPPMGGRFRPLNVKYGDWPRWKTPRGSSAGVLRARRRLVERRAGVSTSFRQLELRIDHDFYRTRKL